MARGSRSRLLKLVGRDYRPNAWRRRNDIEQLLSQFHNEFARLSAQYGRWIPYTMPAVDEMRDALGGGTILPVRVPLALRYAYVRAFERGRPRVTRSMMRAAINAV